MKARTFIFFLVMVVTTSACKRKFEPISYGHDACTHCRMTIMDKRFAAELITKKGKAYKFDDMGCLLKYMKDENFNDTGALIFVADYSNPGSEFLDAYHAVYLHNTLFKSPMNGDFAAFASALKAKQLNANLHGALLKWPNLK